MTNQSVKQTKSNLPGPGPGRPKGIPNKVTGELKAMILQALDGAGGVEYLQARANDPRTASAFLTLVGKVLTWYGKVLPWLELPQTLKETACHP